MAQRRKNRNDEFFPSPSHAKLKPRNMGKKSVDCDTSSIISAISFDPNSNLVGPANIRQKVVLSPRGKSLERHFHRFDQFDQSGNTLAHITSQLAGTRVAVG